MPALCTLNGLTYHINRLQVGATALRLGSCRYSCQSDYVLHALVLCMYVRMYTHASVRAPNYGGANAHTRHGSMSTYTGS